MIVGWEKVINMKFCFTLNTYKKKSDIRFLCNLSLRFTIWTIHLSKKTVYTSSQKCFIKLQKIEFLKILTSISNPKLFEMSNIFLKVHIIFFNNLKNFHVLFFIPNIFRRNRNSRYYKCRKYGVFGRFLVFFSWKMYSINLSNKLKQPKIFQKHVILWRMRTQLCWTHTHSLLRSEFNSCSVDTEENAFFRLLSSPLFLTLQLYFPIPLLEIY